MGHKHSSLHSQLKNQSDGPNCDLVGSSNSTNPNNNFDTFINIKHGPFRRKLSMRNISIRRSFHISGSKHNRNNNHKQLNDYTIQPTTSNNRIGLSATTDQLPSTSSSLNNNNNHIHNYHQTPVLPRSNTGKRSHNKNREKSIVMDRLRKSFRNSFRKKKSSDIITESQKPHQWQSDEQSVRSGNCVFPIKYLGCVEVYESRGMQICEDALRRLRNSRRRPIKGQLYVTGDGIRVVDDDTKGLIVDQTIEKVSFCAPDRSHERGFSYICRDGTTRRWMCHGFHATKDSGERLSHAVGCAFNICLERKQKRDKESVSAIIDSNHFTRTGSFRQSTITERLQDPQVAKPSEPVPLKQPVHNPYAVARPHATASLLQRQGSLRGGPLNASPFKRQLSLRINSSLINDTSSLTSSPINSHKSNDNNNTVNDNNILHIINENNDNIPARNRAQSLDLAATFEEPLIEMNSNKQLSSASSVTPNKETSSTNNDDLSSTMIAAMCQQLSHDLNMLSLKNDVENSSNDRTKMQLTAKRNDSNNNNTNKLIGTGLPHLVKDKNSLFTFSNIDQWVSNKTTSSTSTTATTTTTLSSNEINLSQQLNTGSIDSGIATSSGSSLNGSIKVAINSKASTLPPAVVDRMPDVCAPPPPPISSATSSPSPSQSSVFCPPPQSSSAVPMTTSSYNNTNNKVNGAKNPFLISDISENLLNDNITSTTVNEFKSTNPFIDLSQTKKSSINDDSLNDNFSTDVSTILTSIAAPVTAATMTTTAAAASSSLLLSSSSSSITTNTNYSNNNKNNNDNNISSQMIKAFEVSM